MGKSKHAIKHAESSLDGIDWESEKDPCASDVGRGGEGLPALIDYPSRFFNFALSKKNNRQANVGRSGFELARPDR